MTSTSIKKIMKGDLLVKANRQGREQSNSVSINYHLIIKYKIIPNFRF